MIKFSDHYQKIVTMIPPVSEVPSHLVSKISYSPSPRILSLDVIRGIGILGALFVSIWIFGGFTNNQQTGVLLKSKGFDYRIFGTVDLLLTGKMKACHARFILYAFRGRHGIIHAHQERSPGRSYRG